MRRLLLVFVLVALSLGVVAAPASAHAKHPLVCRVDMAVGSDEYPDFWGGTVSGDIRGKMEVHELPWSDQGPVLYTFAESWVIVTRCGTIKGFDMGIWYPDFSFNASGWVTEATGKWSYLVGWMFYQAGTTSDANVLPVTIPDGLLVFMPPLEDRWGWMRN